MELIKDFDCTIDYHPGKANVVDDALSKKTIDRLAGMVCYNLQSLVALREMNMQFEVCNGVLVATIQVKPMIMNEIRDAQLNDSYLQRMKNKVQEGSNTQFFLREDGTLVYESRICVPKVEHLKNTLMNEAHNSPYAMHPRITKMYHNLKSHYWWSGLKKEIAEYVARCLTC